jgi:hypothetical protein
MDRSFCVHGGAAFAGRGPVAIARWVAAKGDELQKGVEELAGKVSDKEGDAAAE